MLLLGRRKQVPVAGTLRPYVVGVDQTGWQQLTGIDSSAITVTIDEESASALDAAGPG